MTFLKRVLALFIGYAAFHSGAFAQTQVLDVFGRPLNERGITLVDWDGYMANPLLKFYLLPPTNAVLPGSVTLTADGGRLYFDNTDKNPSEVSLNGPQTERSFGRGGRRVPFRLSIFPAHTDPDSDCTLTLVFTDARQVSQTNTIPIHVMDLDSHRSNEFHVTVNFDRDTTGFFTNAAARFLVQQAADDWSYYFSGMHLDTVARKRERTWIWTNDVDGYDFINTNRYAGFLLYAYGYDSTNGCSTGSANGDETGLQTRHGKELPLRRSGTYQVQVVGNYNTNFWDFLTNDPDWLANDNETNIPDDYYSDAVHEVGHALVFSEEQPLYPPERRKGRRAFTSEAVKQYYGRPARLDSEDHLGGVIDPESGQGAFGNNYSGIVPCYRWTFTKLDLLCAQEIGYTLRSNAAFAEFAFPKTSLPVAMIGRGYTNVLTATGGIPVYEWRISAGSLPPGLLLDPFTGVISGIPTSAGDFGFTVRVKDYHEKKAGLLRKFILKVDSANAHFPVVESAR